MTLKTLNSFARRKAKGITNKPLKVVLKDLPKTKGRGDLAARLYTTTFYPDNKRVKPHPIEYEIAIDKKYYRKYKDSPEIKQAVLHEIAHISVPKRHNVKFKQIAKKLGADDNHLKSVWN